MAVNIIHFLTNKMKLETVDKMKIEKVKDVKSIMKADLETSGKVQSLLLSDSKKVATKGGLKKSRDKRIISHSMVQPIEIVEETPTGQTQAKPMTKVQVGNALLAVNPGLMTSDRTKLRGSENQGATGRPWQFENTSMVTPRPSAEDMTIKERKEIYESQLAGSRTEKLTGGDPQANEDLSPRLQG
jgi:hypothetical protein